MIVVDASVAVKWFVQEDGREQAMKVFDAAEDLAAPDFVVLEVASVLQRKAKGNLLTDRQLHDACTTITRCFAALVTSEMLIEDAVRLAAQLDHSVYDCAYLACARMLDARLVTADHRFLAKVSRAGALSWHAVSLATF